MTGKCIDVICASSILCIVCMYFIYCRIIHELYKSCTHAQLVRTVYESYMNCKRTINSFWESDFSKNCKDSCKNCERMVNYLDFGFEILGFN